MVKERIQYVCELCQKAFTTRGEAEDCESRCRRCAVSPRIDELNLSNRTFNLLYWSGLYTVREIALMSEKDLLKIKGFGDRSIKEVKAKLAEYGIENAKVIKVKAASTNELSRFKNKARKNIKPPQLDPNLSDLLKEQLTIFSECLDWPSQYKQFYHEDDSWENGFCNIVKLEKEISGHLALGYLTQKDVVKIARWERPRVKNRMTCPAVLRLDINEMVENYEVEKILSRLEVSIKGTRKLFLTTIMRFISPSKMGSLDTNLVRAFGVGDPNLTQHQWLDLVVRRADDAWIFAGNWWTWPNDYYKWNQILGFLASLLNSRGVACPHPNGFHGLRSDGRWICADVEMALRAYTNSVLGLGGN